MARGGQLSRQWRLLLLISRPAGITVQDAAQDLGCAIRTIWRDLSVLQRAGFPLYDDRTDGRQGVWRVEEGFHTRLPLKLSLAELAALVMSRQLLAPAGTSVLGPTVAAAFDKITGVLSRDALGLLAAMRDSIGVRMVGAKLQTPMAEHLPVIHEALARRRALRLRYYSFARDAETDRIVRPYHLTYYGGGLYLIAYCQLREAVRIFAVERMRSAALTAQRFDVPADFDVKDYLDAAWGIIRGELVTVRIAFARSLARYVRQHQWHPSQRFRDLPDGRLELTVRVGDTAEVRRWVLGYGSQAEVLAPLSMREALRREAERLAAQLAPERRPLTRVPGKAALARTAGPRRMARKDQP